MVEVEVRLLGPVEARVGGSQVRLGGRKQQILLALLAAYSPDLVSIDRCIDALWGESPPAGARHSLHTYVSNLRGVLDPVHRQAIEIVGEAYRFAEPESVDAHTFERLVADMDADPTDALELWRGAPLVGFDHEHWAQPLVKRWEAMHEQVTLTDLDRQLASGEAEDLIPRLEALIEADPLREPYWVRYMTALYRAGRQADALSAFQRVRRILGDELGIEPGTELADLEERILLHDASLARPARVPSNLPVAITSLIGREAEVGALQSLLRGSRLLTITGAGGCGKTTVALELGRRVLRQYADGVFLLELAPVTDPSLIATELLGGMGLPAPVGPSHLETLRASLAARHALLIFDNCEHLADDVGQVAATILKSAPRVQVLATSRRPLGVSGELTWQLPGMGLPSDGATTVADVAASDAGSFFSQRAGAVSGFELSPDNAAVVASICHHLDGLPLALDLAAARTRVFDVVELQTRLNDRFRVLVTGGRTEVPHHQTLFSTLEWSYDLLDVKAQAVFRRLSVFRGTFGLDAARAVGSSSDVDAEEVTDLLDRLVADSLVVRVPAQGQVRFRMLETLRQFAAEVSERVEYESSSASMLAWVGGLVREGAPALEGPEQAHWISVFRNEMDTIRAALGWAVDHQPAEGLAVAAGMARFWWIHAAETIDSSDSTSYLHEGRQWMLRLLEKAGNGIPAKLRGRALVALGGLINVRLGMTSDALSRLEEARELLTEAGDVRMLGWAWFYSGVAAWDLSDEGATIEAFQNSFRLHTESGDMAGIGFSTLLLGTALSIFRGVDEGRELMERFARFAESSGIPNAAAHGHDAIGILAWLEGTTDDTVFDTVRQSVTMFRSLGNHACLAHALSNLAILHALRDDLDAAATILGIAQAIRDRLAMVVAPYEDRVFIATRAGLDVLGSLRGTEAFESGRNMPITEGVAWALDRIPGGVGVET